MNILVVGGGGREHAIVRCLKKSRRVEKVHCAPGNAGISFDAEVHPVSATDIDGQVKLAKDLGVDLVFVAPDDPLVLGLVDELEKYGIRAFGPSKSAARIEGSKVFSKDLMKKYNIPTAGYEVFESPSDALSYISSQNKYPTVIKADGLALGKGVVIAGNYEEAESAIKSIMEDKIFGASGSRVVVEEFLTGPEVSVLSFTDGKTVVPMVSSMDHKPVFEGNKGPNTGGMGTVSPNPHYTDDIASRCMDEIFLPTVRAMESEGCPFKGCLYFGLMLTADGPKVIEYNCRFGDPETQVVLPRLKTDFTEIIDAIVDECLDSINIKWEDGAAACVILASGGYPGDYIKGIRINGLDERGQTQGTEIFHAGTAFRDGTFVTSGGRVLGVSFVGADLDAALDKAYKAVDKISFEGMQYRRDIGRM